MQSANIKETAHQLIDSLPDDTSWEKLVYTLQMRHDIEAGLKDSEAGNVMDSGELRRGILMDSDAATAGSADPAGNASAASGIKKYKGRVDLDIDLDQLRDRP